MQKSAIGQDSDRNRSSRVSASEMPTRERLCLTTPARRPASGHPPNGARNVNITKSKRDTEPVADRKNSTRYSSDGRGYVAKRRPCKFNALTHAPPVGAGRPRGSKAFDSAT
ncbi:hypothetical protein EVAR_32174_1 [Eumeta japonica]|uniref:Uncharacterized protein n=1 Tax=Eumeta variegata TaxID=151549 RepID=A0A4C1VX64_EUMVA|nr:hypothetical protein EVAR_32174_1 [Eumeta japonica]